jgi:hypothetical protein
MTSLKPETCPVNATFGSLTSDPKNNLRIGPIVIVVLKIAQIYSNPENFRNTHTVWQLSFWRLVLFL